MGIFSRSQKVNKYVPYKVQVVGRTLPQNRRKPLYKRFSNSKYKLEDVVVLLRPMTYVISSPAAITNYFLKNFKMNLFEDEARLIQKLARSIIDKAKIAMILIAAGVTIAVSTLSNYDFDKFNFDDFKAKYSIELTQESDDNPISRSDEAHDAITSPHQNNGSVQISVEDVKKPELTPIEKSGIHPSLLQKIQGENKDGVIDDLRENVSVRTLVKIVEKTASGQDLSAADLANVKSAIENDKESVDSIKSSGIKKTLYDIYERIQNKEKAKELRYKAKKFTQTFDGYDLDLLKSRVRNVGSSFKYNSDLGKYIIDVDEINSRLAKALYDYSINGTIEYPQAKINPFMAFSICLIESNFGKSTVSRPGAKMPMQVMPATKNLYYKGDDNWNYVKAAFPHMHFTAEELGIDVLNPTMSDFAILGAVYNAGIGNARNSVSIFNKFSKETTDYVKLMLTIKEKVIFKHNGKLIRA
ncbi:hypothetical protein C0585_02875 [Candidatus Woesearchaeota archaeon]|nr:MAG: hypothetical protein C0585_02875 [Candidatus Woesearchaeota archaeon]